MLNTDASPRRSAGLHVAFIALSWLRGPKPNAPTRRALLAFRMSEISVHQVLETVGDFDSSGGASLGLVAWELSVEPSRAARAWRQVQAEGLIRTAGVDRVSGEQLWRLTVRGWARLREDDQDG